MHKLKVPLSRITEKGVAICEAVPVGELQPEDATELPLRTVEVTGTLAELGEEYLFRGKVSGAFQRACDRCMEDEEQPFEVDVVWSFAQDVGLGDRGEPFSDDDDDVIEGAGRVHPFSGNEIDLAPRMWEEIVLAAPAKFLCKDDCVGLCPQCGANLNRTDCRCREETGMDNRGLAGLAKMFPELRPKDAKE